MFDILLRGGGILFALLGFVLGLTAYESYASGRESMNWKVASATVTDVEVFGRRSPGGTKARGDKPSSGRRGPSDVTWDLKVTFVYQVEGKAHTHTRTVETFGSQEEADKAAAPLVPNGPFRNILYDPEDHARFVLERGGDTTMTIVLHVVALLAIGLGAFLWLMGRRDPEEGTLLRYTGAVAGAFAAVQAVAIVVFELWH